ncbi:hypothetical protein D3C81_1905120 [compost metagenome]
MAVSHGWLRMLEYKIDDTFAENTVLRRLFGKIDAIEFVIESVKYGICAAVSKTLFRFLFVVGKHYICTGYCFFEHLRHKTDVIYQWVDHSNEVAECIFQSNP